MMNEKLKASFDLVEADDKLKESTLSFIKKQTNGYTGKKAVIYPYLIAAAACLILLLVGGNILYFSPTAEISMDINPSIQLSINRFDRVISVEAHNDDGKSLAENLNIMHQNYGDAVDNIIKEEKIQNLLSDNEELTITVVGNDDAQTDRVFAELEATAKEQKNTYCYRAKTEEVEKAHEVGLSYGKYRAYLEVFAVNPEITAEQIKGMTMREIRELMNSSAEGSESHKNNNNGCLNNCNGNGCTNANGQGNGQGNGR